MNYEQLYNLASFDNLPIAAARKGTFSDSALSGVVLARTLTTVDPKIFQKQFPEFTFVNSGIAVNNIGGAGNYVQSLRKTPQGGFVNAAENGDNKGKIGMSAETSLIPVVEREAFSDWTDRQVRQADMQNINLVSDFLAAHNQLYLQDIDNIGYLGNTIGGLTAQGLLNNTSFAATASAVTYAAATPAQLLDMISSLVTTQYNAVSNIKPYMANRLVLPIGMLNKAQKTILNSGGAISPLSVLAAFKVNFPEIEVMATYKSTAIAVAYSTSPEGMVFRIPEPLMIGEIIKPSSFKYRVDTTYSVAGLDILEKDVGYIMTGLA